MSIHIKHRIEALGMSVNEFASLCGIHRATLYRWFNKGSRYGRLLDMAVRYLEMRQRSENTNG